MGGTTLYSLDEEEVCKIVFSKKYNLDGGRIALGAVFLDLQHIYEVHGKLINKFSNLSPRDFNVIWGT